MKHVFIIISLLVGFQYQIQAQHIGYGVKGGLTIGIHKSLFPLISYHGGVFVEHQTRWTDKKGTGKFSRVGVVGQLSYHRKGYSYTNGRFFGNAPAPISVNDVFHNLSLLAMVKGAYKFGNFAPYFLAGFRGDFTLAGELVALSQQGVNIAPPQLNRAMFGFTIGGGADWEPPKLPFGFFLEATLSPDVTPQVVNYYRQVYNVSTGLYTAQPLQEPERTINFVIEVSVGIKFLQRKKAQPATAE